MPAEAELKIIYIIYIIRNLHICSVFCDKKIIPVLLWKRGCIINRCKLIYEISKNIRIKFPDGFIEGLLAYSFLELIYGRIKMGQLCIGSCSVSEDEIVNDAIEVHVSVTGEVPAVFSAKVIDRIRPYDGIQITEKLR